VDPELELEKTEAREAAARGVQAALQLLEELGDTRRGKSKGKGGSNGASSGAGAGKGSGSGAGKASYAQAGPSDVLTVGGGGPPNGARGRATAGVGGRKAGRVGHGSPSAAGTLAALAATPTGTKSGSGVVVATVVRYGSGKRLG